MTKSNWIYITESLPIDRRYKTVAIRVEGYYCDYTYQTLAFYSKKKECWYDYKKNKIKDYVFAWRNGNAEKIDDPAFRGYKE